MYKFTKTTFGDMLELDLPKDCDLVIVCFDNGAGHKPCRMLLPHQIYRQELLSLFATSESIQTVTIIPVRSKEKIILKRHELLE